MSFAYLLLHVVTTHFGSICQHYYSDISKLYFHCSLCCEAVFVIVTCSLIRNLIITAELMLFLTSTSYDGFLCGVSRAIAVITIVDYCIWRPLFAWSTKYKYGQQASADAPRPKSVVLLLLERSILLENLQTSASASALPCVPALA